MIEMLQQYREACQRNLDDILSADIIDDRAVIATQGMIDGFTAHIEGLLV